MNSTRSPLLALAALAAAVVLEASGSPERRLVIRTHEIARSLAEIAEFLGIAVATLDTGRAHEGRSHVRYRMLERIDPSYLRAKIRQHCAELMARFFPEYDLLDRPAQGRAPVGAPVSHG